jgi:cell shape-determining protein MreC
MISDIERKNYNLKQTIQTKDETIKQLNEDVHQKNNEISEHKKDNTALSEILKKKVSIL